jgi:hypothetical protein
MALLGIIDADVAGPGRAGTLILAAVALAQIRESYVLALVRRLVMWLRRCFSLSRVRLILVKLVQLALHPVASGYQWPYDRAYDSEYVPADIHRMNTSRMTAKGFSSNFLRFRFEYASLVWDCLATGCSNKFRWHARAIAFLTLPPLPFLPAAILVIGAHPFGNAYAFGAAIILWPFILEVPGRQVRQAVADGTTISPSNFDFFFFVVFTMIAADRL